MSAEGCHCFDLDSCQTCSVQRCQNRCYLCPKSGLNLAETWLFTSFIQDINVIVGLKLLTTGTNVTTVLCEQGKKLNMV